MFVNSCAFSVSTRSRCIGMFSVPTLPRASSPTQTTPSLSLSLFTNVMGVGHALKSSVKRLEKCLTLLFGPNHGSNNLLQMARLQIPRTFLDVGRRDRLLQMVAEDDQIQDAACRMPSTCKPKVRRLAEQFKLRQPSSALHLLVPHGCLLHEVGERRLAGLVLEMKGRRGLVGRDHNLVHIRWRSISEPWDASPKA